MGALCFASTPNQVYSSYLNKIDPGKLKEFWETTKLYKIKQLYEFNARPQEENSKKTIISYQSFKLMLPQLQKYQQIHKKRVFLIFDFQNKGFLDWNNFFTSISICYFAPEEIMSVFMFMIFDEALTKQLTKDQVYLMTELNQFAVKKNNESFSQQQIEIIAEKIMGNKDSLSIDDWLAVGKNYFDFHKYRRVFNIFQEQKLQKELIANFNDWNDLYNEKSEKYVSYVMSYKWFQIWKLYVEDHYGVEINLSVESKIPTRSFKSKKSLYKKQVKTKTRLGSIKTVKFIEKNFSTKNKLSQENMDKISIQGKNSPKNIDFIHNNIGSRPKEIFNHVLEGEYQQVMKGYLVQNRDYVLVSEKVWQSLREIYSGGPQFRRTGYDQIELYPKIVKIYSSLFNNQIDYSSQILREVPSHLTVQELLTLSIQIPLEQLSQKSIYFKTIGMQKWQQIQSLDYMFAELSEEIVIFLIYLEKSQNQIFKKTHLKLPQNINEINPGDIISFYDEITSQQKQAVFMGKNIEGKYIIHFPKQSYSLDKCIIQQQALKCCKLIELKQLELPNKLNRKIQTEIRGIPNVGTLGFISSTILNLSNNLYLKNLISILGQNQEHMTINFINRIFTLLSSKTKINPKQISELVGICFPKFKNFQISLSQDFLKQFYEQIAQELNVSQNLNKDFQKNTILQFKSSKKCLKCTNQTSDQQTSYFLELQLPIQKDLLFQITFVPISTGLKSTEIKKYGILLSPDATLKQLKEEFQKKAQIQFERSYILAEVYSNKIVKNYHQASLETPLKKLKLRHTDSIYAFQLYDDFNKFINDHFPKNKELTFKQVKVDTFLDCKHPEKGWIFGKVCEIEYLPYTHQTLIKILHKFSKDQQWEVKYDFSQDNVVRYPTKSYLNAEQYHLQAIQRYFNEAVNEMQICNVPLVVVLTSWMRWKEFNYLIYLQLKRFIHQDYQFQDLDGQEDDQLQKMQLVTTKEIKSSKKIIVNYKKSKFKDYLNGEKFPYKVRLTDTEGRCAICFKFVKNKIFKGEMQNYCEGCNLSQSQPISWQVKVADVMVCIDWKGFGFWKTDTIREHSSLINLLSNKKKQMSDLNECLKAKLDTKIDEEELLCCNRPELRQQKQSIVSIPQIVPIYLSRVIREDDGYRNVNSLPVAFSLRGLKINESQLNLIGMTAIEGKSGNVKYKTYMKRSSLQGLSMKKENNGNDKGQDWVQYDGQVARLVNQKTVSSACALTLYYKRQ